LNYARVLNTKPIPLFFRRMGALCFYGF